MLEWIISSTVLMAIILLLRLVLKGRISLRLQYALWLLVAVRLLVPVSLGTSRLSVMNPVEHSAFYRETVATEATATPNVSAPNIGEPDVPPVLPSTGTAPVTPVTPVRPADPITPVTPIVPAVPQPEPEESGWVRWGNIAKIVWLVGGAGMLFVLAAVNLHLAARLKRSRTPLQTDSPLPVWQSSAVQTPCLFGLWRPTIYVTAETAADETVLCHCLRHEETHYRHGDHLWAVVRALCLAIHWYHPLVWLAAFCSKNDAELACDEATIRTLGESERAAYGRTLLALTGTARPTIFAVATTMTDGKVIKERIKLIVKKPKTAVLTLIAVIVIAAVAVGCTYTGAGDEKTPPNENQPAVTTSTSVLTTATTPPMSDLPLSSTTTPPDSDDLYYDVSVVPGIYRLYAQTATDPDEAVYEAAEVLVGEMLDAMKRSDPSRSFTLTEYKDVELRVHHSSEVLDDRMQEWGIAADSALINDDVWLVYVDASFRFEGVYAPIGKPIDDRWWTVLHQGSPAPMILLKTADSYVLWWANAYAEGYPQELAVNLLRGPNDALQALFAVSETVSLTLKQSDYRDSGTYVIAEDDRYAERTAALLQPHTWVPVGPEFLEDTDNSLRLEFAAGNCVLTVWGHDVISYTDGHTTRLWGSFTPISSAIPVAHQVRAEIYDRLEYAESLNPRFLAANAAEAVELYATMEYPVANQALTAGNAYRFLDYQLNSFEVWQESDDGLAVVGRMTFTFTTDHPAVWGNAIELTPDATRQRMMREFVLVKGADGYWSCTEWGSSTSGLPAEHLPEAMPQNGPLTEQRARALLADRDAAAELIAFYPAGRVDYLLYRLSDGYVRVDAYSGQTGEPIETDILANRGYGDYVICAYDAVDAEISYWYTLSLYVSRVTDGELAYPEVLRLQERDGTISLSVSYTEREILPLGFHKVAIGNAWATPELRECRIGFDSVSLALAAPGDVVIEGNACFPQTSFAYDAETHTLVVTMKNTLMAADLQVPQEGNSLVADVELRTIANGVELCLVLREGAFSYVSDLRTVFFGAGADGNLGIIEISILQDGPTTVRTIAY